MKMMKLLYVLTFFFFLYSCGNKNNGSSNLIVENHVVKNTRSIDLEVYNFDEFSKFLNKKDDKVYVINFWATWCAPCVKELPYFERINKEYGGENVEVILVSLDFPHLYESRLKPFIVNKKLKSKVIALDDPDMNNWIPKVDSTWSGSIPATIIYKNSTREFFERSFTYNELETELKPFLK